MLDQKGNLIYLMLSANLPSFEIFGSLEATFSYFTIWKVFEYWKTCGIKEKD
jgi:hypothetical protein